MWICHYWSREKMIHTHSVGMRALADVPGGRADKSRNEQKHIIDILFKYDWIECLYTDDKEELGHLPLCPNDAHLRLSEFSNCTSDISTRCRWCLSSEKCFQDFTFKNRCGSFITRQFPTAANLKLHGFMGNISPKSMHASTKIAYLWVSILYYIREDRFGPPVILKVWFTQKFLQTCFNIFVLFNTNKMFSRMYESESSSTMVVNSAPDGYKHSFKYLAL